MSKEKKSDNVVIPQLQTKQFKIRIVGTSTLIVHAWDEKSKQEMRDKQQKQAKTKKQAKDPEACFLGAKYLDRDGNDCVPVISFKSAIVAAARFAEDLKMTVLRGALFVHGDSLSKKGEDLARLTYSDCIMREDMVRVGMGTADMRYRPEYHNWSCELRVEYNETVISLSQIVNLLNLAGFSVGVCEWRPEKNGQHGRFSVDSDLLA